ncbi:MAG: isoprenylcysteine carboxylmethyltransferase family protein [Vicinamibacterales bacterium]
MPLAILLVMAPASPAVPLALGWVGMACVVAGELIRLWAVRHIGVVSRTRAGRLGPLVVSGPYRLVRHPLYVGNFLLWMGFTIWSRLWWMVPVTAAAFAAQYGAIARWEASQLRRHFGDAYDRYASNTPAWLPRTGEVARAWRDPARHSVRQVLFSERGTLLALGAVALLLMLK